jgi:nucleotide-binding universal stress UspA family protein
MKVLLAYDGFNYSSFALDEAIRLGREEAAEITVLSVVPPEARGTKSGGHAGLPPHADEDVIRAFAALRDHGVQAETTVAYGKPAEEIVERAKTGGFDLVLMGTRELGPIERHVLGSVSHKVVKHAPCPVLIVGEHGQTRFEPEVTVH